MEVPVCSLKLADFKNHRVKCSFMRLVDLAEEIDVAISMWTSYATTTVNYH